MVSCTRCTRCDFSPQPLHSTPRSFSSARSSLTFIFEKSRPSAGRSFCIGSSGDEPELASSSIPAQTNACSSCDRITNVRPRDRFLLHDVRHRRRPWVLAAASSTCLAGSLAVLAPAVYYAFPEERQTAEGEPRRTWPPSSPRRPAAPAEYSRFVKPFRLPGVPLSAQVSLVSSACGLTSNLGTGRV
eukprot:COSAG02_NODE_891_length_16139_cov_29.045885_4_plen_187_part_00